MYELKFCVIEGNKGIQKGIDIQIGRFQKFCNIGHIYILAYHGLHYTLIK